MTDESPRQQALHLRVHDRTTTGNELDQLELQLEAERLTARALITSRVEQEVRAHNAGRSSSELLRGLIDDVFSDNPLASVSEREAAPQALVPTRPKGSVDASTQVARAVAAFERGQFLLLVDDRQVAELDEIVTLSAASDVVFLRLVPLQGG